MIFTLKIRILSNEKAILTGIAFILIPSISNERHTKRTRARVVEEGGEKQASTWPTPIFNHPRQKISRNRVPPFGHTGFCFLVPRSYRRANKHAGDTRSDIQYPRLSPRESLPRSRNQHTSYPVSACLLSKGYNRYSGWRNCSNSFLLLLLFFIAS